jgi:ferritin-like metal-binding protein YciE
MLPIDTFRFAIEWKNITPRGIEALQINTRWLNAQSDATKRSRASASTESGTRTAHHLHSSSRCRRSVLFEQEPTMSGTSLHDAFVDELRDAYDAEKQLLKALTKMAKAATSPDLQSAFEAHLEETRGHVSRLEEAFSLLEERARGKHCDGIAGIIEEGKSAMEEDFDDATMDACLIAAGQRAEHYEMAAYGTMVAWAKSMGHDGVADLLQQTLDEEKAADQKLTGLAESGITDEAAAMAHSDEDMEQAEAPPQRKKAAESRKSAH